MSEVARMKSKIKQNSKIRDIDLEALNSQFHT